MTVSAETARDMMMRAAVELGWTPPGGSAEDIAEWCAHQIGHIPGGQDRDHALAAVREALVAAYEGNAEYVRGGLAEALKTCKHPAT